MKKFIYLALILSLASCKSYQLSTYYTEPVTINGIEADVIENEFQLDRKFRLDDKFRWNFAQYAMNQDLRWYSDFYFNNRMYRSPFSSPFDFYWNSQQYWWNWSSNYSFNYGFNHWDTFGFYGWNNYRWNNYYYLNNVYTWNNWRWNNRIDNNYWEDRSRRNVAYINGRRGSRNTIVQAPTGTVGRTIVNVNTPRLRNDRIPTPNDIDIVIERPDRSLIGRFIDKMEDKGIRVRTYNNPNQINNDKIIRPNPRSYNRTESGNNGGRSWNRQNVPPQPTRSRQPNAVQPRQVRGGSGSPVLQQSRSSQQPSSQGRSSSSRIKN